MANKTWAGVSGDYSLDSNWSGGVALGPGDTGIYTSSGDKSLSNFDFTQTLAGWTFTGGDYTFTFASSEGVFFDGAGIVVNGGSVTLVSNSSVNFVNFFDSSSAGSATINANSGSIPFRDTSTAANAVINLTGSVFLSFFNSSSAGDATITSNFAATINFRDASRAGTSDITSNGGFSFSNSSTADHATIVNQTFNFVRFEDSAKAGSAVITNHRTVEFLESSSAENATIINKGTSTAVKTEFKGLSTAGNARLIAEANATVDFSFSNGPANNGKITAGSIDGAGAFKLGDNELTVGSNNRTTTVSGVISDGGGGGGSGGSLVKVGTGTLILNGANTYTGKTTVKAGILGGKGTIDDLIVNAGGTVSPGASAGILHAGTVEFAAGATVKIELGGTAVGTGYDQLQVNGVVALGKAKLAASLINGFDPSSAVGQKFTIVNNNGSADAVSDTFAGLAEGAQLTAGNRLFTITYQGGDGNDVVLTSGGAKITGTAGIDLISAGQAPVGQHRATELGDIINGLDGDDTIDARGGNDIVNGGLGRDKLLGGLGLDAFVFDAKLAKANADVIADLLHGTDEVRLDIDVFTKLKLGDLKKSAFYAHKNADEAKDAKDRIVCDTKSGECFYDKDGEGGKKAKLFAILDTGAKDISHEDFVVVA